MADDSSGQQSGLIERSVAVIATLTFRDVLILAILVVLAVPSYAMWQLLNDGELRREILSYAREVDMAVPCQVVVYAFSGQRSKSAVIANVDYVGPSEVLVATRITGTFTQKDSVEACAQMNLLAGKVRDLLRSTSKEKN